jgi:hypothetical protein
LATISTTASGATSSSSGQIATLPAARSSQARPAFGSPHERQPHVARPTIAIFALPAMTSIVRPVVSGNARQLGRFRVQSARPALGAS